MELELTQQALVWVVVIAASVLRSFTGFGFALAGVPFLAFFLPPAQVVVLIASLSVALGVQTFPQYASKLQVKPEWPLLLAAVVGTVLGALILQFLSEDLFRLALGILVIGASLILSRYHPHHFEPGAGVRASAGLSSGLMNGAFAIPGPPIVIYVMATQTDPARARASMIAFFSFSSAVALINYAAAGLVSLSSLWLFLLAYPAMYLGDKLGYALFLRYGGALYRRVSIIALVFIGVSIIARSLW